MEIRLDSFSAVATLVSCEPNDRQPSRHPPTDPVTHYVLTRGDLPLGVLAAQVTHAAGESSPGKLPAGTYAVVLSATPEQLKSLSERLTDAGVRHRTIIEHDGDLAGQVTAIGVEPRPRSELRRWFSSYPLLR